MQPYQGAGWTGQYPQAGASQQPATQQQYAQQSYPQGQPLQGYAPQEQQQQQQFQAAQYQQQQQQYPQAQQQYAQQQQQLAYPQQQQQQVNSVPQGQLPPMPLPPTQATPVTPTFQNTPDPALLNREQSDSNGLRWTWSTYPNTERPKGARGGGAAGHIHTPPMIIPLSCMYTPLQPLTTGTPEVQGQPELCKNCGSIWSRHSRVDVAANYWACLSCFSRNPLPKGFDPQHPALLHDTVEYVLGTDSEARPTFLFVIDTCIPQEEMEALKRNLLRCVEWLPPLSLVGFVTFGHGVTLWELGCEELNKCYCLRGTRQYSVTELTAMLNVSETSPVLGRFLCPLDECEFALNSIIDELSVDPFPVSVGFRPQRATGTAIDLAVRLMEFLGSGSTCGKVALFCGGPCTRGPGKVVGVDKAEMLRFHRDFMDGNTPHYQAAFDFYNDIAGRLQAVRGALDVFAESFDQVGITELRRCVNNTGGTFVCGDTFDHQMFTESFQRSFQRCNIKPKPTGEVVEGDLETHAMFGLQVQLLTSADTLISGVIGPCSAVPLAKAGPTATPAINAANSRVSPLVIGLGGTTTWSTSCADESLTLTFVFDTETSDSADTQQQQQQPGSPSGPATVVSTSHRFFQFQASYVTATGQRRIRVSTVVQPVAPLKDPTYFVFHRTFDQACAAAVTSRMAVWLMEQQDNRWESTKRWLDKLLVQFVRRFGTYTIGQPDSLRLAPCLSLFPSFVFNLRRSEFFMVQNISPDETTFKRHWMMREPCDSCVLMIQPTLFSYTLAAPVASPVPLDSTSLVPDHVLLMDAFFNVHVLWGATVYEWLKMKYHENPDFAHFKAQVDAPDVDAAEILKRRFPYPRFSKTDVNGSESRHVKTRLNPTTTHNNTMQSGGEVIYTDDASVTRFMQTLKAAAVAPEAPK